MHFPVLSHDCVSLKAFLESTHSFEPHQLIYLINSRFRRNAFERRARHWLGGNCREEHAFVDGPFDLIPVVVYRPLVNRFSGQKLRVMSAELSNPFEFASGEKLVLRNFSGKYAEANCIFLFICLHGRRGYRYFF